MSYQGSCTGNEVGNGVWESTSAFTVDPVNNSGPMSFGLSWSLGAGDQPVEDNSSSTNLVTGGNQVAGTPPNNSSQDSGEISSGTQQLQHGYCTAQTGSPCVCTSTNPCNCSNHSGNTCQCVSSHPCDCSITNPANCNCNTSGNSCDCVVGDPCLGSFDGYSPETTTTQGVSNCTYQTDPTDETPTDNCGEIVWEEWAGAYGQESESFSRSGPLENVVITNASDPSTGGYSTSDCQAGTDIQSVPSGTSTPVCVALKLVTSYFEDNSTNSAGDPVSLNAGDDDVSGEWDCSSPVYQSGNGPQWPSNPPEWG